jgi:hypothetical protein
MSERIVFNNFGVFNTFSKKIYQSTKNENICCFSKLKLNQFREFFAIYCGYNNKHEIEKTDTNKTTVNTTDLSSITDHILESFTERFICLDNLNSIFLLDIQKHLSETQWQSIFIQNLTPYQPDNECFIFLPLVLPLHSEVPLSDDLEKIAKVLSKLLGTPVKNREDIGLIEPFSRYVFESYHDEPLALTSSISVNQYSLDDDSALIPGLKSYLMAFSLNISLDTQEEILWYKIQELNLNSQLLLIISKASKDWFSLMSFSIFSRRQIELENIFLETEFNKWTEIFKSIYKSEPLTIPLYTAGQHSCSGQVKLATILEVFQ